MSTDLNMNEILLEVAESINELKDFSVDKKYLSVEQASKRYNVSKSLFRKWILQNQIQTYRFGKLVRLCPSDIEGKIVTNKPHLQK